MGKEKIKDFIVRLNGYTKREEAKVIKVCKALAKEVDGEYYTKEITNIYNLGHIVLTPPDKKDLFWRGRKL